MPYIVCVNQPLCLPEQDPRAVATLEEARAATIAELDHGSLADESGYSEWHAEADNLSEGGGVVGPLPDGYVIDVRPTTYKELRALAGIADTELYGLRDERREQILDAYNGVQR